MVTRARRRVRIAWKWPTGLEQRCAASGKSVGTFVRGGLSWSRSWHASNESLPSWHAKALNDAVLLAVSQADYAWGEALCQENLVRCRELGDRTVVARTLYLLGWLALLKGNLAMAHSRLSESLALFREVGDNGGSLVSLFWMGVVVTNQGEYIRAQAMFEQTLAMQRELGNKRGIAWSLFHLAWVHALSPSDILPIRSLLTEAEALFKEIGEMWGIAECYQLLGRLALQQGNVVMAHTRLCAELDALQGARQSEGYSSFALPSGGHCCGAAELGESAYTL